jgi:hypothetical protein
VARERHHFSFDERNLNVGSRRGSVRRSRGRARRAGRLRAGRRLSGVRGRSQGELDAAFGQRRRSDLTVQSTPLRTPPHRGKPPRRRGVVACPRSPAHHPSRQTYGLEQKGDGPVTPVRESRLGAAASPAFDEAPHECLHTYPWKKFPNGLAKHSDPERARGPAIEGWRERRGTAAECPIA